MLSLRTFNISTLLFSTFLFVLILFSDVAFTYYCTESECAEITMPYNSPCKPVHNCTKIGFRRFLDPDRCNCCEYCFDYLEEGDICETSTPTKPISMCGPRLSCKREGSGKATCQPMDSAPPDYSYVDDPDNFCMKKRHEYDEAKKSGSLGIAQIYPECDAHGFYAPRQCLPGSVCYCSDLYGRRIFGLAASNEYQDCACARDISRLQEFGFSGRFPHCLPNGDYDELQCVVRTCYCRSHPEEKIAMHELNKTKCYDPLIHVFKPDIPQFYMKNCELTRARLEVQIADEQENGRKLIIADMPVCDPDGNYAPIQSKFNKLFCANATNGNQIEHYEAEKFSPAAKDMNCYCARAVALLWNSATGLPKCCSNGNYRPWQCIGTTCFCVDTMGRQDPSIPEEYENNIENLPCYNKCP